ncbi:hypothetical protein ACPUER_35435 [Burkholderia sp. DN3021]|uniref:hypothetical protein n=1 Tax=Burkholderia sp. DN3021 TaxID=3410137 RepID=UPI003C7CC871
MELIDGGAREPLGDPRLTLFENADAEALGADNAVVRPCPPTQARQVRERLTERCGRDRPG